MKSRPDPNRTASSGSAPGPAAGEHSVLDWARQEGAAERVIGDLERYLARRRRRRQRTAVAVAAVLLMGSVLWRPWDRTTEPAVANTIARDAKVLRPAQRTLPDGTHVELNAGAEIEVDFSGPLRRVVLRRGEGHFQVAKDPLRPFVVSAGEIEVRAVGTAFAVDRAARGVEVLVTEGRVAVEQPAATAGTASVSEPASPARPPTAMGTLDAGGRMVVTRSTDQPTAPLLSEVTTVSPQAIEQRLAWRVPRLEFSATPLARAVVLFNEEAARRGDERLVLGDPALGRVLLSGVLRADDIESLLRLLEGEFQIRAERQGGTFVLRR